MRDETPSNELKAAAKHIARVPVDRAGRFPVSIVVSGTVFSAVLLLIVAQERHAASSPRPTTSKHDHWGGLDAGAHARQVVLYSLFALLDQPDEFLRPHHSRCGVGADP